MIQTNKYVITNRIIFLISILFIFNCSKKNKVLNIEALIYKVVDTTVVDPRKNIAPSLNDLSSEINKKKIYTRLDSIRKIKMKPLNIIIDENLVSLKENIMIKEILISKYDIRNLNVLHTDFNYNLNTISDAKYNFFYKSKYLIKDESLINSDVKIYTVTYSFSQIYFDKSKNRYYFTTSLRYGRLNAASFLVFFKFIDGKIIFDDILQLSIS